MKTRAIEHAWREPLLAALRITPVVSTAAQLVGSEVRPGDMVLVKASRAIALEQVAEALLAAGTQTAPPSSGDGPGGHR